MPSRQILFVIGAVAALLVGCSSSGPGPSAAPRAATLNTSPSAAPAGAGSGSSAAGAVSPVAFRFADFFTIHGKPGPALDLYDAVEGQAATPVLKNLAYGSVTDYLHPRYQGPASAGIVGVYALPAGEDPVANHLDASGVGGYQDDGSHPQVTWILTGEKDTIMQGPLAGLSFSSRVEKGTGSGATGLVAPAPPAGKGEFLVDTSETEELLADGHTALYLLVDSSCAPPLNGDPNMKGVPLIFAAASAAVVSTYAIFPADPGSHSVAVVAWSSIDTPSCSQLTEKQGQQSLTVAAGQQVELYVYGTSWSDLRMAVAPLQP